MKNKAIIITGANGNVGSYFTNKFVDLGENLILIIHNQEHRIKEIVEKNPERIKLIKTDISDLEHLKDSLDKAIKEIGWQPDRLIHTITIRSHDFQPLVDSDANLWKKIIDINLVGTFNILKCVIPYFKKYNYGKIVLFASDPLPTNITSSGDEPMNEATFSRAASTSCLASLPGP